MFGQETEYELTPADREMEAALGGLTPVAASADMSDALFEAGRRSQAKRACKQVIVWRSAAAVLLATTLAGPLLRWEPTITQPERVVYVDRLASEPSAPPRASTPALLNQPGDDSKVIAPPSFAHLNPESVLALRTTVLERGLDGLPTPLLTSSSPQRVRETILP